MFYFVFLFVQFMLFSVLLRCWLGGRKGIPRVKNRVVGCWHGCLSRARGRLAYGPADATATHCLASVKSRLVWPFWCWLTRVVPNKGPLNECVCLIQSIFCIISYSSAVMFILCHYNIDWYDVIWFIDAAHIVCGARPYVTLTCPSVSPIDQQQQQLRASLLLNALQAGNIDWQLWAFSSNNGASVWHSNRKCGHWEASHWQPT